MSRVSLFFLLRMFLVWGILFVSAIPWIVGGRLRFSLENQIREIVATLKNTDHIPEKEIHTKVYTIPMELWAAFRGRPVEKGVSEHGDRGYRYRLAGTIQVYAETEEGKSDGGGERKAVIEDLEKPGKVMFLKVGDMLGDGSRVRAIERRMVILDWRGEEIRLRLRGHEESAEQKENGKKVERRWENLDLGDQTILSESRFGVQIEDRRWVYDRRRVLDYYNEVLEDGQRLVAVFDSLKPLYNDDRKINGYILVPEGEQEFFQMVGLQEGDIVRKVNSMPLTSRRIAESFIRDFANGELGAVVLEIERAGEPVQLIYELR